MKFGRDWVFPRDAVLQALNRRARQQAKARLKGARPAPAGVAVSAIARKAKCALPVLPALRRWPPALAILRGPLNIGTPLRVQRGPLGKSFQFCKLEYPVGIAGSAGIFLAYCPWVVTDVYKTGQQIQQGEVDKPAVAVIVRLLGDVLGIPATQAIRSYKGWMAWT